MCCLTLSCLSLCSPGSRPKLALGSLLCCLVLRLLLTQDALGAGLGGKGGERMCWEEDEGGGPGSWGFGPPCPPLPLLFRMRVPCKISLEEGVAVLRYAGEPLSTDPG